MSFFLNWIIFWMIFFRNWMIFFRDWMIFWMIFFRNWMIFFRDWMIFWMIFFRNWMIYFRDWMIFWKIFFHNWMIFWMIFFRNWIIFLRYWVGTIGPISGVSSSGNMITNEKIHEALSAPNEEPNSPKRDNNEVRSSEDFDDHIDLHINKTFSQSAADESSFSKVYCDLIHGGNILEFTIVTDLEIIITTDECKGDVQWEISILGGHVKMIVRADERWGNLQWEYYHCRNDVKIIISTIEDWDWDWDWDSNVVESIHSDSWPMLEDQRQMPWTEPEGCLTNYTLGDPFLSLVCNNCLHNYLVSMIQRMIEHEMALRLEAGRPHDRLQNEITNSGTADTESRAGDVTLAPSLNIGHNINIGGSQTVGSVQHGDNKLHIEVNVPQYVFINGPTSFDGRSSAS
ncbi:uncharacterized protein LOC141599369 [Silene latifolia]|uniref:uncharacterized protein LOC141599369 n=1 Tax=Silene latifolia TaxID=37657 RepID=UPI003D7783BD